MSKSNSCFGYPLSIFFIVVNEFCERFSYYGMKAILILYFKNFISWNDNLSTAIYHTFVALCYLTPILGALIADSWLGKFKTIVSLSIVYTIGQAVISISSINDLTDHNHDGTPDSLTTHVLALIALGTGGIKPCVSAFGGDQFEEDQEKQRNRFFSIFYLAINAGSLLSTIITPMLRVQQCGIHSQQACYPLAFGVPAALMAVSLIVFVMGSSMYKKYQPQGNVMAKVVKCIGERLICQIKMVTKVMFLYIPLPMFWALFDQQGSRWTLQATTMNGKMGAIEIQPDQMQTVNAILIVIMVPIFDGVLYPLIAKCGLNFTSLKRMTTGMFLAAMAFVVASVVQMEIDTNEFMTFDVDKLTSINISSAGSPATAVTQDFTPGQRHTLLVWAPNRYRVVNDSLNMKPEKGENGIRFVNTFNELISVTMSGKVYENITSYNASQYQFFTSGIKTFTLNSPEILPQCSRDFQSSYLGFGSAYTYVIQRKK
ncbi:solute carrier family 15 member 1 [Otolemur garnettii]|uniref:solute carrier family 15 member 1 n=1 Tax=Otolemur garnettii TaxID=30611 RepID=UPI000C7F4D1E|nr:solute carrier family 15 member 1 [Otolemur garnettii]